MEVTLLGTGDTTGTPVPGCDCDTCEAARERGVERTRFSVHVRNERTDECLLVDASPDFRQQFLTHDVALPDAAVITHIHFDHLDGLGNAYRLFRELPVYAADVVDPATGETIADTIVTRYDYLAAVEVRPTLPFDPVSVCGLEVTLVPVYHPPMDCYGVVVEDPETGGKLSITGDTCFAIPERTRERLADPDLLVADALGPAALCEEHPAGGADHDESGTPRSFGDKHMTREGALSLAEELDADRTRLVHLSHFYPPEEAFEDPLAVDGERHRV